MECRLERPEGGWRFLVENDAPDLRSRDLRVLCEPFWRKDRARADRSRSGLGLALSWALAEKTGMELGFELTEGTFRAVLSRREGSNGAQPSGSLGRLVASRSGSGALSGQEVNR